MPTRRASRVLRGAGTPATGTSDDSRRSSLHLRHGPHDASHRADEAGPLGVFAHQVLPAGGGELVKLGAAILLGSLPAGCDPALGFQPFQGRIERAELDIQRLMRDAANAFGDSVAMQRAG